MHVAMYAKMYCFADFFMTFIVLLVWFQYIFDGHFSHVSRTFWMEVIIKILNRIWKNVTNICLWLQEYVLTALILWCIKIQTKKFQWTKSKNLNVASSSTNGFVIEINFKWGLISVRGLIFYMSIEMEPLFGLCWIWASFCIFHSMWCIHIQNNCTIVKLETAHPFIHKMLFA